MTSAPQRPHTEVGVIELKQNSGRPDQAPELVAEMRTFAGQQGCEGLVIIGRNDTVTETMDAPGGGTKTQTLVGYRAACIVYTAAASPPPPSAAAQ